jgi:Flp pilus assembly protein TadG
MASWRPRTLRTRRRGGRRRCRGERGSITVELVVLAPALALLLLLIAAGARVVEVQGHIDGAARDAARAASLARSLGQADALAAQAADADLGSTSWCESVPAPIVSGFPNAGQVTVTVTCTVNMSPFGVLGFNATRTFTGTAVAPLDPFVCRTGQC